MKLPEVARTAGWCVLAVGALLFAAPATFVVDAVRRRQRRRAARDSW